MLLAPIFNINYWFKGWLIFTSRTNSILAISTSHSQRTPIRTTSSRCRCRISTNSRWCKEVCNLCKEGSHHNRCSMIKTIRWLSNNSSTWVKAIWAATLTWWVLLPANSIWCSSNNFLKVFTWLTIKWRKWEDWALKLATQIWWWASNSKWWLLAPISRLMVEWRRLLHRVPIHRLAKCSNSSNSKLLLKLKRNKVELVSIWNHLSLILGPQNLFQLVKLQKRRNNSQVWERWKSQRKRQRNKKRSRELYNRCRSRRQMKTTSRHGKGSLATFL